MTEAEKRERQEREREKFEKWAVGHFLRMLVIDVCERNGTGYNHGNVQVAWRGWQARASEESDGWISVEDELPTHNYTVLGFITKYGAMRYKDDYFVDTVAYFESHKHWRLNGYDEQPDMGVVTVSHWRPLPSPPSAAQETGK